MRVGSGFIILMYRLVRSGVPVEHMDLCVLTSTNSWTSFVHKGVRGWYIERGLAEWHFRLGGRGGWRLRGGEGGGAKVEEGDCHDYDKRRKWHQRRWRKALFFSRREAWEEKKRQIFQNLTTWLFGEEAWRFLSPLFASTTKKRICWIKYLLRRQLPFHHFFSFQILSKFCIKLSLFSFLVKKNLFFFSTFSSFLNLSKHLPRGKKRTFLRRN